MTLSKIAQLAHVSVSTASKAFSMSSDVNEQTRERVFEIAKKHGCFKKYYRAEYPNFVIAVICPEVKSPYYAHLLTLLQKYLSESNCEICVASTEFSVEIEKKLTDYYTKYASIDGIIFINRKSKLEQECDVPIALIDSEPDPFCDIRVTNYYGEKIADAIDYFVSRGVKDIGFIGEKNTVLKHSLFRQFMEEKVGGVNEAHIKVTEKRFEDGGYSLMKQFFEAGDLPRAIICAYDRLAIGAMRCIHDRGLRVPEDIAILGMDDIPEARFLTPTLSSINPHNDEIAQKVTRAMLDRINGNDFQAELRVEYELNLRESTRID